MFQVHVAALTALIAAPAPARAAPTSQPAPAPPFMRGIVVSCPGYGRIWGSPEMAKTIRTLRTLGVNWIQIHPYAGIRRDGTVRWQPAESTGYLPRAAEIAKREGVQMFWKPHLAYWGSFKWRGAITFDREAEWTRFFDSYRSFIVDQARFAEKHNIPLFSIGLEYHQTLSHEAQWRSIIKAVRRVYNGQITYAANWDRIEQVPFWDALDMIGVQAYFPLSKDRSPTLASLEKAWSAPLATLNKLSKRFNKPFVFAEIGYSRSVDAAARPWEPQTDDSDRAIATRRRLMEAALSRLKNEPQLRGMFWWKWLPRRGFGDHDFAMQAPEATSLLQRYWAPSDR